MPSQAPSITCICVPKLCSERGASDWPRIGSINSHGHMTPPCAALHCIARQSQPAIRSRCCRQPPALLAAPAHSFIRLVCWRALSVGGGGGRARLVSLRVAWQSFLLSLARGGTWTLCISSQHMRSTSPSIEQANAIARAHAHTPRLSRPRSQHINCSSRSALVSHPNHKHSTNHPTLFITPSHPLTNPFNPILFCLVAIGRLWLRARKGQHQRRVVRRRRDHRL